MHHRFSDHERDPHDASRGFWYSHILHLFFVNPYEADGSFVQVYASDLLADRYLAWLDRNWIWFALVTLPIFFLIGGLGMVVWSVFLRLVLTWHIMWLVNSASHKWGYKNYSASKNRALNCWWVGLLAAGEGWHNNHQAFPRYAAHGHRWWELDLTYLWVLCFEKLGVIHDVKRPDKRK
jgi:fatty-acid desaturase